MNATSIPMQPKGFPRLRRRVWTLRAFLEYRRRLNGNLWRGFSNDPWRWSMIWQLAESSAQNEADSNDRDGYRWDTPAEAVASELECWSE